MNALFFAKNDEALSFVTVLVIMANIITIQAAAAQPRANSSEGQAARAETEAGIQARQAENFIEQLRQNPVQMPANRPRLFQDSADEARILRMARNSPGFLERMHQNAVSAIASARDSSLLQQPLSILADMAIPPAQYYFLTGDRQYAYEAIKIIRKICGQETWIAPVHIQHTVYVDHVAANVAARIGIAVDYLGEAVAPEILQEISQSVAQKCLDPFRRTMRERADWWTKRDCESNWRIMTCGDAGLAALAFAEFVPNVNEALAFAIEGVADIFDLLPEDGAFVAGPNYFILTYGFGMRFGIALHRMTGQNVNILQHPALVRIPDYILHVTRPGGAPWNYCDNAGEWSSQARAYILLLAGMNRRNDLIGIGRHGIIETLEQLLWDPVELRQRQPEIALAKKFFPAGIITMRSDWTENATFVGIRCAPNDQSHSHLDAGAFVFHSGKVTFVTDPGVWQYDHFHGFFDPAGPRWDYDANATIAHSSLLIDGRGQLFLPGQSFDPALAFETNSEYNLALIDLTRYYPDRSVRCWRWFVYIKPDMLLIFDDILLFNPYVVSWILSHEGKFEGDFQKGQLAYGNQTLAIQNLNVESQEGWRGVDEKRTTNYWDSNAGKRVSRTIQIQRYERIHPAKHQQFMFLIHADAKRDIIARCIGDEQHPAVEIRTSTGNQHIRFVPETRQIVFQ